MNGYPAALPVRTPLAARLRAVLGAYPALAVAAVTFAVGWAGLLATHRPTRVAVPERQALAHVWANPRAHAMLAPLHWTRVQLIPLDRHNETLCFYRGSQLVATVDVGFDHRVVVLDQEDLAGATFAYGSAIANDLRMLIGLSVVFVLMTAVWPLRRLRNLDVAVVASSAASIALFNHWTFERMAVLSYAALAYLAARCAWRALTAPGQAPHAKPLFEHVTAGWPAARQVRVLRLLAAACVLILVIVGLSSPNVLDVGYAVMEGATAIVHGLLPYGHVADVLHGDTYPIGSYLLYTPFALLWPVHTLFDDAEVTLAIAVCAGLGSAWAIRRLSMGGRSPEAEQRGLRAAIAWMTFPPLLLTVSTGTSDIVLAVLLLGALLLWRKPAAGTAVLSLAAWFKLVPLALGPLWIASLPRPSRSRALLAASAVSLAMLAALILLGGVGAPARMAQAVGFQFTRSAPDTLWTFIGSVPLQQFVQAITLALIAGGAIRLWRDRAMAIDRTRVAALCAAVLLGVQLAGNYWTFMYLTWALPFVLLSLLLDPESEARWKPAR